MRLLGFRSRQRASEPPPPVRTRVDRDIWVGVFVITGIVAVFAALFLFAQPSLLRGRYTITTVIPSASGIRRGDPVELKGVVVGRVIGFEIDRDKVRVRLEIEEKYQMPRDSTVQLASGGLLGGMVARIEPGVSDQSATAGTVLEGTSQPPVIEQVGRVAAQSEELATRLQKLVSDETVHNLQSSTAELDHWLAQLSAITGEQRARIDQILRSLEHSARNVERLSANPRLQQSMERLDQTMGEMQATAGALRKSSESLEVVLERMRQGHGTLGMLSTDESLYVNANGALLNLGASAMELRKLAEDIRLHPSRYVHVSVF